MSRTKKRWLAGALVIGALGSAATLFVAFLGDEETKRSLSDEDTTTCGLSAKQKAQLVELGVSEEDYCRRKARADAVRKAQLEEFSESPPDPRVVAPRLIGEFLPYELRAWERYYEQQTGARPKREWSVPSVSDRRTTVELRLVTDGETVAGPARWAINLPLARLPTPAEERALDVDRDIVALNEAARRLERVPNFQVPATGQVTLESVVHQPPANGRMLVTVTPSSELDPGLLMRTGQPDAALVRGKRLLARAPKPRQRYVKLSPNPIVTLEQYPGPRRTRNSSLREMRSLFGSGSPTVLLEWRTRARDLAAQLRRPVRGIIVLSG